MKLDYFGYTKDAGHFWNSAEKRRWLDHPHVGPIDGVHAPRVGADQRHRADLQDYRPEAPEGIAALVYVRGWTVIAYWDRSGDKRGASNTAFAASGRHTFEEMLAAAKEQWPQIFQRHARFEVTQQTGECAHEIAKNNCGSLRCTACGQLVYTTCRLPIYGDTRRPCVQCFGRQGDI